MSRSTFFASLPLVLMLIDRLFGAPSSELVLTYQILTTKEVLTDAMTLRKTYRILGQLVGQLPQENLAPMATSTQGLPLLLSPYEVYLGFTRGWISVTMTERQKYPNITQKSNLTQEKQITIPTQRSSFNYFDSVQPQVGSIWESFFNDPEVGRKRQLVQDVFNRLWDLGFYLHASSHLYCDLVAYPSDPLIVHAQYLVVCIPWKQRIRLKDLMSYARLASTVKKTVLLASDRSVSSNLDNQLYEDLSTLFLTEDPLPKRIEPEKIVFMQFRWQGLS
jgi:tRNA splicing endonuclease